MTTMKTTIRVFISKGGRMAMVHSDRMTEIFGRPAAAPRASEVEYDPVRGGWTVVFRDGSALPDVYPMRAAALAAEVAEVERRLREGRA